MVEASTLIRDALLFIAEDLSNNITDPILSKRKKKSKFIATSFPEVEVQYPMITIKQTNLESTRAGMQTDRMDVTSTFEIRIWARAQQEKDKLFNDCYDRLREIQFTANVGSIANHLHSFQLLSAVEIDEPGEGGIKSRIAQVQYRFYNV